MQRRAADHKVRTGLTNLSAVAQKPEARLRRARGAGSVAQQRADIQHHAGKVQLAGIDKRADMTLAVDEHEAPTVLHVVGRMFIFALKLAGVNRLPKLIDKVKAGAAPKSVRGCLAQPRRRPQPARLSGTSRARMSTLAAASTPPSRPLRVGHLSSPPRTEIVRQ